MQHRPATLVVFLVAALAVLGSCGSDGDDADSSGAGDGSGAAEATATITAKGFAYAPTEIELTAGEAATIEVDNQDDTTHNLTIGDLDVDDDVEGKDSISVPITPEAGTYEFQCKFHSQMKGTITVS